MHTSTLRLSLFATVAVLAGGLARGQALPAGFVRDPVGGPWSSPVALEYVSANHLLVAERGGAVYLVEDGVTKNRILDLSTETLINGDRGMLGIAAAPDFYESGLLYLLYVVDPDGQDGGAFSFSRLVRLETAFDAQGELHEVPGTRTSLLGETWSSGIPSCHLSHTIGSLRFLSDGSLVLTAGDNARYDITDPGGASGPCFAADRTSPDQDLGAFRSQYDDSLCGKVLRLDPATGQGLSDNPFFTGNATDLLSRVWARGLRNPVRFSLLPDSGPREALFISDVGWSTWEEINLCLGGENFGWPCYEGRGMQPAYQSADPGAFCATAAMEHTPPKLSWHHNNSALTGLQGNCVTGLVMYTGTNYPEIYRQRLFFCDYGGSWMKAASFSGDLELENFVHFGANLRGPVEMVTEPETGDLVYVSLGENAVYRIRYQGASAPPIAHAVATPAFGGDPLTVTLDAGGSTDPDGLALSYAWDLGDGTFATGAVVMHEYSGSVNYVARLTVTDSEGLTSSDQVLISPGNTPPVIVNVATPEDGATYTDEHPVPLRATTSDAEGGPLDTSWSIDLVHDHHLHPDFATVEGPEGSLSIPAHGDGDNHLIVRLRVEDERGLVAERSTEIFEAGSSPLPHLTDLSDTTLRVGQRLQGFGHVDYSLGRATGEKPALLWDWGDGDTQVFEALAHAQETAPVHRYRRPGTYELRLVAQLAGHENQEFRQTVEVVPARPAVAIFTPFGPERWISHDEQAAITAALAAGLAGRTSEVTAYQVGEGARLAAWMESVMDDSIQDVLVLLDFVPGPLFEGDEPLLQRWIADGNGVVWSGQTPLEQALYDDGSILNFPQRADAFFESPQPFVANGAGNQTATEVGTSVLPALAPYVARRALRYDRLGAAWRLAHVFAEDGDQDSDALEVRHADGGFYAQFYTRKDATLPRAEVLLQYLQFRMGPSRRSATSSVAPLR